MLDLAPRLQRALPERYTIEREIGRGGMAVVYLARDHRHDRSVALKVLTPDVAATLGPERFLREIAIAAQLQHPHILPLYDSGEADGLLYYVMPHVEGETLRAILDREKQLPLDDALRITQELGDALSYAHSRGVVHRDIKPENVFVAGTHAVIADFGIARALRMAGGERLTSSGVAIGTPAYMSPEQAAGTADVDARSDIYALGCVLYEMLSGEPPFSGPTAQAVMARHAAEPPRSLRIVRPTVPAGLDAVVARALAKVPADRYRTATEFVDALAGASRGPARSATRRRLRTAARALGLAVLAALAGVLVLRQRASETPPSDGGSDLSRLAVLYFDDNSEGGGQQHVANGLTEALIAELGAVEGLHVLSASAVRPFQGRNVRPDSIARALDVGVLVEGSIAHNRDTLRVSVRLVDGRTGGHLHGLTIHRRFAELFTLQDSLAADISRFLRERLGEEIALRRRRAATPSVAAWELVQRADLWREDARRLLDADEITPAAELLARADTAYAEAETLDPSWIAPVVARGWLARQQALLADIQRAGSAADPNAETTLPDPLALIAKGLEHAERALRVRPAAPEALELRGALHYERAASETTGTEGLLEAAEADLRAALRAEPTRARAWYTLSRVLQHGGRFSEAHVAAENALRADAYLQEAREVINHLLFAALNAGRFDDARQWCATGLRRFPRDLRFADCELTVLGWSGAGRPDVARAWRLVREREESGATGPPQIWAYRQMMVAAILARSGLRDSARAVVRRTRDRADAQALPTIGYDEAYVRTLLGEHDEALQLLSAFLRAQPQWRPYVARTPWFEPLHGDPRFHALVGPKK